MLAEVKFEKKGLWSPEEFAEGMKAIHEKGGFPRFRSQNKDELGRSEKEQAIAYYGGWMEEATITIDGEKTLTVSERDLGKWLGFLFRLCPIPTVTEDNRLVFEWKKR